MAADTLVERAITLLAARGPTSPAELARYVFGGEALAPLLDSLGCERLMFDGVRWQLLPPSAEWAFLEILATGPNPRQHRIVELAARRGKAHFQALIASNRPVPKLLRKLGVPEDQGGWLSLEDAASGLRELLRDVTVVGFGYAPEFLEQLLGPSPPAIDLLRLVQTTGFGGRPDPIRLARHFHLRPPLNRRPEAMLAFSAALFDALREGRTLAELRDVARPLAYVPPEHGPLPGRPGVYVMAESTGRPLYVGKSVHLRRRVSSYLRTPVALSRNLHDLMQLTGRIEVIPVDSELEALLLEDELIQEWNPAFNVQRRRSKRPTYLRLSMQEAFPRITPSESPAADGAAYFGPFRHATAAARLRDVLRDALRLRTCRRRLPAPRKPLPPCTKAVTGACLAPCIPGPPAASYGAEVELAKQLLGASPERFRRLLRRTLRERAPALAQARELANGLRGLRAAAARPDTRR